MNSYYDEYIGLETMLPDEIVDLVNMQNTADGEEACDFDLDLDGYELAMDA